ncbi:hypothetical protein ACLMJK_001563 [Lecanora helva]
MGRHTLTTELADPTLLNKIDKFFELGIGEYVALPQLLVVGDQSSGKSSVLEGLTSLPYPRDSGLCTRFATQITFRRGLQEKISVSVIPAQDALPEYSEKLRNWKKDDLVLPLRADDFSKVLQEVHELMDLGKPGVASADPKKTFANDVLKIEICGPKQDHLSVIDVPGIFKKTTPGVTSKNDMAMVRNMVNSYMQNPRSVILAVIPANVDIATQEILEMAEECDAEGQRTLGVLTKPDLVDKGAEQGVVDIVDGKSHSLNLGWCVVKNPGQQALTHKSFDRDIAEELFLKTEASWNTVAKDRLGIEALRTRLIDILADVIKREFPRTITALALKAHYGGDEAFEAKGSSTSLKLATAIVTRNANFAEDIEQRGHTVAFEKDENEAKILSGPPTNFFASASQQPASFNGGTSSNSNQPKPTNFGALPTCSVENPADVLGYQKSIRYKRDYCELEDVVFADEKLSKPRAGDDIKRWLKDVYTSSRGFELGTFDASILPIVWKKQCSKWEKLALGYVSDVITIVHEFTQHLLRTVCEDERIVRGLKDVLLDHLLERYKRSMEHTRFILSVERFGTPITTNHYFTDNLERSRNAQTKAQLQRFAFWDPAQKSETVKLDQILNSKSNASNEQNTIDDLHDILKSYYKVARKRFVDTVCMQAADFYLVTGPDAPTKVFSPTFVGGLTPEQLESIAGEDLLTKRKRIELTRKIENLEVGRKIALA